LFGRALVRYAERMAIRVAAGAELYANLKPQQAAGSSSPPGMAADKPRAACGKAVPKELP
jgi:hypothetical protein